LFGKLRKWNVNLPAYLHFYEAFIFNFYLIGLFGCFLGKFLGRL
jgi:hypothetical protein